MSDEQKINEQAAVWMTRESRLRLRDGGNCKGAVPVHGKRSNAACLPLFDRATLNVVVAQAVAKERELWRADAERYRWLRDEGNCSKFRLSMNRMALEGGGVLLDSAIDGAIRSDGATNER